MGRPMSDDGRFPLTRHSVVVASGSEDPVDRRRAWDVLAAAYWKPVYKYLRLQWRVDADGAGEWTQEFFARAMAGDFFAGFDPQRARFRTYLRVCLDAFVQDERTSARRQKRGGGVAPLSLDFAVAEGELAGAASLSTDRHDDCFHREWLRTLFEQALADLQRRCAADGRERQFAAFRRHDLDAPERGEKLSYADLAREFDAPVTQVTNWLHLMRQLLRQALLGRLRELCGSEEEFHDEVRALFGVVRT